MAEDIVTVAAQQITHGDYMGAMATFEEHITNSPDDPAGYHGWAEAALFEIQGKMETSMIKGTIG